MPAFTNPSALPTISNYLIPHFSRVVSDRTLRQRLLWAKLKSDGRVVTNKASDEFRLPTEWKESTARIFAPGATVTYESIDRLKHTVFNTVKYINTDMITDYETVVAKGPDAIVDRSADIVKKLGADLEKLLSKHLYNDGYANAGQILGFDSWAGTGTTVTADILAKPDDSYGGLDTDLGAYGGTWSDDMSTNPNASVNSDWPFGQGDTTYDFHTPKLFNWSSTSWPSGASNTFINTGGYTIRGMITAIARTGGVDAKPKLVIMDSKLFVDFKNLMDDSARNILPHQEGRDLGFPMDVLNYEGLMVTHEYDCPANCLYMLSTQHMELAVCTGDVIDVKPVTYESGNLSYNYATTFYGQLMMNPKYQGKAKNYAA